MTHDPLPPGMHECDWCGKLIPPGTSLWGQTTSRRIGDPPARSWIACSEEHLGLVLARDRWGQPKGDES